MSRRHTYDNFAVVWEILAKISGGGVKMTLFGVYVDQKILVTRVNSSIDAILKLSEKRLFLISNSKWIISRPEYSSAGTRA